MALKTADPVKAAQDVDRMLQRVRLDQAWQVGTLDEVLPKYYAAKGHDAKATRLVRKVILDGFKEATCNARVDSIDARMIDEWRGQLSETGGGRGRPVSLATLKSYTVTLRAFVNWAREEGLIHGDPLAKLKRQMRVTTTRVQGFLTEDDREALLAADAPDYVRLILHLGFFAGLRYGEMLALNPRWLWFSEDGARGTLTVQDTQIRYASGKAGVWQPKGRKTRTIPLHPRLLDFLRGYGMRDPWLLAPGNAVWPADDAASNFPRYDSRGAMRAVAALAGVKGLTFHIMRHSFATHLVMKGVTLAGVAGLLGDTLQVTEQHYAGFAPGKENPLAVL
jgi:integrase